MDLTDLKAIAATSGRSLRQLQRACKRLGIAKTGVQYLLTRAQCAAVVAACHDGPGCPLFGKGKEDPPLGPPAPSKPPRDRSSSRIVSKKIPKK